MQTELTTRYDKFHFNIDVCSGTEIFVKKSKRNKKQTDFINVKETFIHYIIKINREKA